MSVISITKSFPKNSSKKIGASHSAVATKSFSAFDKHCYEHSAYTSITGETYNKNNINYWEKHILSNVIKPRSNHYSFIKDNYLYIVGGIDLKEGLCVDDIYRIDFNDKNSVWELIKTKYNINNKNNSTNSFPNSFKYSKYVYVDPKLYVYGGYSNKNYPTNEFYCLDLNTLEWSKLEGKSDLDKNIYNNINNNHKLTNISNKNISLNNNTYKKTIDDNQLSFSRCSLKDIIKLPNLIGHIVLYWKDKNAIVLHGGLGCDKFNNKIYIYLINENKWNILYDFNDNNHNLNKNLDKFNQEEAYISSYMHDGVITNNNMLVVFGGFRESGKSNNKFSFINLDKPGDGWNMLKVIRYNKVNEHNNEIDIDTDSCFSKSIKIDKNFVNVNENISICSNPNKSNNNIINTLSFPPKVTGHSLNYDDINNKLYLFGGKQTSGIETNELWELNICFLKKTIECQKILPNLLEIYNTSAKAYKSKYHK